jgi:hypothetical protein
MKGSNGRATFSMGGAAKVPAWVPDYPGSDPQSAFSAQGRDGESGTFTFKTHDSSDKVARFYQDQLPSSGLHITNNVTTNGGVHGSSMLVAEDNATKHTITVIISAERSNTTVAVTYANK